MNIFLTGGTGFIGYALVGALVQDGHNVKVLIRNKADRNKFVNLKVKIIIGDLDDDILLSRELKGIDIVYHLAAIRRDWGYSWSSYCQTNILLTEKVVRAAVGKVKHFILVSSVKAKTPESNYARSKKEAEDTARRICLSSRLPLTIIRPAIVYGPGDHHDGMIPKLIGLIKSRKFFIVGNGQNRIHLVYITDLISALVSAGNKNGNADIYTIAGEKPITLSCLAELIARELRTPIFPVKIPYFLAYFSALLFELVSKSLDLKAEPLLTVGKLKTITQDHTYDIKAAKEKLNFSPKVNYQDGIKETLHSLN